MFKHLPLYLFIRYAYGGFLLVGLATVFAPNAVRQALTVAGPAVSLLVIFFAGACIYVVNRHVLGEFLVYPLMHVVHAILDRLTLGQDQSSSVLHFMGTLGVPLLARRAAYTQIRREFLTGPLRVRLDLAHTEVHVLYITALEFTGASLYLFLRTAPDVRNALVCLSIGILVLIAGFITDIQQHKLEYGILTHAFTNDALSTFLSGRGFIRTAPHVRKDA